ncbi:MAG: hypothetical protein Q7R56_00370 [Nanoarchaeota archaeon]|nr:hypothetical protein [Nanoarchaeota archaeon]
MRINLLVLRTQHLEPLKTFYETLLGTTFERHTDHGPAHYSTNIQDLVLELYPTAHDNHPTDMPGLAVENIETFLRKIPTTAIHLAMHNTARGTAAIIKDPDGRLIYLTEQKKR